MTSFIAGFLSFFLVAPTAAPGWTAVAAMAPTASVLAEDWLYRARFFGHKFAGQSRIYPDAFSEA